LKFTQRRGVTNEGKGNGRGEMHSSTDGATTFEYGGDGYVKFVWT